MGLDKIKLYEVSMSGVGLTKVIVSVATVMGVTYSRRIEFELVARIVELVVPATVGVPTRFPRDVRLSNTIVTPGGKLVEEISVMGTLLVKYVAARKKFCPATSGTPVYKG
jgi:hypothetical protein